MKFNWCATGAILNVLALRFLSYVKWKKLTDLLVDKRKVIMRFYLIVGILSVAFVQVSATSVAQYITIRMRNAPMEKIFQEIKAQTGYVFVYNSESLKDVKIDLAVTHGTVEEVLADCLAGLPFSYRIINNNILIRQERLSNPIRGADIEIQRDITGNVKDERGNPLEGVTVSVKGAAAATTTDKMGNYRITRPQDGASLVFTIVGYESREIPLGSASVINTVLTEAVSDLAEVVVVGYGTQRRQDQTTASSTVDGGELRSSSTANAGNMLEGQVGGLSVQNNEGTPGGNPIIRIRGATSLLGSNEALVVVDGLQRGNLGDLNPSDIESMEVLKGPAATAIYGSEGANGVILVTTKRGKTVAPDVSFSSSYTYAAVNTNAYQLMDAATFARYANLRELADNLDRDPLPIYSDEQIAAFENTRGTDWMKAIFRGGSTFNNALSISGRGEKINYLFSGGYLDQQGTALNSGNKRYTLQTNLSFDLLRWMQLNVNWLGVKTDQQNNLRGGIGDKLMNPLYNALIYPSVYPVYDEDGNYTDVRNDRGAPFWSFNPVATALEPINRGKNTTNNVNTSIIFTPFKDEDLSLEIHAGARFNEYNFLNYNNTKTFQGASSNGRSSINYLSSRFLQNTNILRYRKQFNRHNLEFTGIYEQKHDQNYQVTLENRNFPTPETNINDLGSTLNQVTRSAALASYIRSWAGRVNYNFDDRYLASVSYRADGSSVFGADNKWGYFPSASLGWRISEEQFLSDVDALTELKLRVEWGITGNQAIAPYQSLSAIGTTGRYPLYGNGSDIPGYGILRPENPDLKWEETEQQNVGIDLSLFQGKFTFVGDYFHKITRDMLMPREVAEYTGVSTIIGNAGKISNTGVETIFGYSFRSGDFTMSTNVNFTKNYIKVLDLGGDDKIGYNGGTGGYGANEEVVFMFKGERFGQFYLWVDQGTWGTDERQQALRYGQLPGDTKYLDVNDDGIIDEQDRVRSGSINPDVYFGINSQMTYRNFGFSFNINGVAGNKIMNQERMNGDVLLDELYSNRWTETNQQTNIPAIIDERTRAAETAGHPTTINIPYTMFGATTRFLESGSFVRLRNVRLSYNLAGTVIKPDRLKNFTIYLEGENLVTITNYSGFNPSVSAFREATRQGFSVVNYPVARTVSLGLTIGF